MNPAKVIDVTHNKDVTGDIMEVIQGMNNPQTQTEHDILKVYFKSKYKMEMSAVKNDKAMHFRFELQEPKITRDYWVTKTEKFSVEKNQTQNYHTVIEFIVWYYSSKDPELYRHLKYCANCKAEAGGFAKAVAALTVAELDSLIGPALIETQSDNFKILTEEIKAHMDTMPDPLERPDVNE